MILNNEFGIKTVTTNKALGNYLVKNGFPLLCREGKLMIFSKTKNLTTALESLPLLIKITGQVVKMD